MSRKDDFRLWVGVLGPLRLEVDRVEISVGPPKARGVLSFLATRIGNAAGVSEIVEALWGEDPPLSARKAVQVYVSGLRRKLPVGVLRTVRGDYLLDPDVVEADVGQFEMLLARASDLADDPRCRSEVLGRALDLWRGEALPDISQHDIGRAEAVRLTELRLRAEEERCGSLLQSGLHQVAAEELMALVGAQPLREERWALLMIALYRCGRKAEALRSYQQIRSQLANELGIEPGTKLSELELRILRNDPSLDLAEASPRLDGDHFAGAAPMIGGPDRRVRPRLLLPDQEGSMVGRTAELSIVDQSMDRVFARGRNEFVLGSGEPGSGKTTLPSRAGFNAFERGATVMHGCCDPYIASPYQIFYVGYTTKYLA